MKYYKCNYKYQLSEDFSHKLYQPIPDCEYPGWFKIENRNITIYKGYAWDGAPVINTKTTMVACLMHDCIYQAMRLGLIGESNKKFADKEYFTELRYHGMCWLRAACLYFAAALFGARACKKGNLQGQESECSVED